MFQVVRETIIRVWINNPSTKDTHLLKWRMFIFYYNKTTWYYVIVETNKPFISHLTPALLSFAWTAKNHLFIFQLSKFRDEKVKGTCLLLFQVKPWTSKFAEFSSSRRYFWLRYSASSETVPLSFSFLYLMKGFEKC